MLCYPFSLSVSLILQEHDSKNQVRCCSCSEYWAQAPPTSYVNRKSHCTEFAFLSRNTSGMRLLAPCKKNTCTLSLMTFFPLKIIWSQNLNILLEHKTKIYILALADLGTMPRKTNMFSLISPKGKAIQLEINTVGLTMQYKTWFIYSEGNLNSYYA